VIKIKKNLFFSILFLFPFLLQAQTWELVWSDEFEGASLDVCNWTIETGNGQNGWGTGQVDYATARSNNVRLEGGNLILEVHKETDFWGQDYWGNWQQWNYTSGRIITRHKVFFQYGKIEARLKIHEGQGIGSAFWMLPQYEMHGVWPRSGEIDIMETNGDQLQKNHGTVHFERWGTHQYDGNDTIVTGNLHTEFHTYAIEWDDQWIKWLLDGEEYHRFSTSQLLDGRLPFREQFFIILSTGVGSQFSGTVIDDSKLPTQVVVDYVRVYKNSSCCEQQSYLGSAHLIPGKIEAENYDLGGTGISLSDYSKGNTGGAYRSDDVDIETTSDLGGGYNVGWTSSNEWLEYTVNVQSEGYYKLNIRAASASGAGSLRLHSDCEVLGNIYIPNTGGWQNWQTFTLNNIFLKQGEQVLKVQFLNGGEINLNYIQFEPMNILSLCPIENKYNIKIYPVPFTYFIKVSLENLSGAAVINLKSTDGKLILERISLDEEVALPAVGMERGIYILEIIQDGYSQYFKIVKE
jgi:beta-glucanase (GH16 family)